MESLDRVFDVLSKERRRYVLYYLDQSDEPVSIEELTEKIREWESSSDELNDETFDDVYLSLTHNHLPKAARAKYIEYDSEESRVEITGEPSEFKIILSVGEAIEKPSEEGSADISNFSPSEFFEFLNSQ